MTDRVCAIVLNWNSGEDTIGCVAALQRQSHSRCRILIVDNRSRDGSVDRLRAALPNVELLELDQNLGYAGGNNRAIAHALAGGCDFVWLLNPDVRVAADALAALLDAAAAQPRAALLGPIVYMREDPERVLSAGGVLRDACVAEHRGVGELDAGQFGARAEVDFVSGCALLVRRAALDVIGPLDESFFVYQEDVDWGLRARRAGFTAHCIAAARAWHPDTRLRDVDSPLVTYYIARNTLRFARKHRLGARVLTRLLAAQARTLLSWSIRPMWRHKRAQRDALARAMLDFVAGRAGRARGLPDTEP